MGDLYKLDWLGTPLGVGSRIVWPCDAWGTPGVGGGTKQVAVGYIIEVLESGLRVRVERRSRTGAPKTGYDRGVIRLTPVGMANATVIG